jgi:hypothetical protein
MKQQIYGDPWAPDDWDLSAPSRVWVHLLDAAAWLRVTGTLPPCEPVTAQDYVDCGLPWFDYYREDLDTLEASPAFRKLETVFALGGQQDDPTIPQEDSVTPGPVHRISPEDFAGVISEWDGRSA